uniref:Uncharacterized protein n=1 Tax=Setaria viridis TaxID=4556 RepID=A0A4U6VYG8_SETVI|nr:hypothetical protein SEVIR_2G293600v2 [Setaria viridis]
MKKTHRRDGAGKAPHEPSPRQGYLDTFSYALYDCFSDFLINIILSALQIAYQCRSVGLYLLFGCHKPTTTITAKITTEGATFYLPYSLKI